MRFGLNSMIWVRPFTTDTLDILRHIRACGGEVAEITMGEMVPLFDIARTRETLQTLGLEASMVCGVDSSRDLTGADADIRANGVDFVRRAVEVCGQIGARVLCGPLHAPLRSQHYYSADERAARFDRCVASYREIARSAEAEGVDIAIEPLNRFESDFLNTAADACALAEAIGSPRIGVLLDTFHMNIEERDIAATIRASAPYIKHFHACESDRGAPGAGHIAWPAVFAALAEAHYDSLVVIESYNWELPQLAERMSVWRALSADQDTLAREGLSFLREMAACTPSIASRSSAAHGPS